MMHEDGVIGIGQFMMEECEAYLAHASAEDIDAWY